VVEALQGPVEVGLQARAGRPQAPESRALQTGFVGESVVVAAGQPEKRWLQKKQ